MVAVIVFVIILSVLVLLHELGHFLSAKRAGIKVEEFGLGLPPRAWGKKIKGTIYSVNWLPFGGFVRLKGEDPEDVKKNDKDSFYVKSLGQRTLVVTAGVLVNFFLAVLIFYGILIFLGFKVTLPAGIEHKFKGVEQTSNVVSINFEESGQNLINSGELIKEINGDPVVDEEDLSEDIEAADGELASVRLSSLDSAQEREANLALGQKTVIESVVQDSPASLAGFQQGDEVVSISGKSISDFNDFSSVVQSSRGQELIFELKQPGEETREVVVVAELKKNDSGEDQYLIGVGINSYFLASEEPILSPFENIESQQKFVVQEVFNLNYRTFGQKVFSGFIHSANILEFSGKSLAKIVATSVRSRDIGPVSEGVAGPVGIVAFTQAAVSVGVIPVFELAGLLSLNLAVLNILPIPALDGGRFFFILAEVVTRKRPNPKIEKWAHTVGFAFLIGLILLVTYNDVLKLLR